MGIQSTITLSREEAERLYVSQVMEGAIEQFQKAIALTVSNLDDKVLEHLLEEEFFNYQII